MKTKLLTAPQGAQKLNKMKNILKTTACATICALFLTAGPDKQDNLSVTPNNLQFEATSTDAQLVKVTTGAKSWDVNTNDGWLKVEKVNNGFNVSAVAYTSYDNDRNGTITVSAGNAEPVTVTVTQTKLVAPRITDIAKSNYKATGVPSWLKTPGPSTWTGQVVPHDTVPVPYYTITNFGGDNINVFCDFKDGKIVIDNYSVVASDGATYKGYFRAVAYDESGSKVNILSDDYDYVVAYNKTTKILDFSGTYNGLPILVGVLAKNVNTNNYEGVFTELYKNLKLQLTPVSQSSISSGISTASSASTMKAGPLSQSKSIKVESFKNVRIVE